MTVSLLKKNIYKYSMYCTTHNLLIFLILCLETLMEIRKLCTQIKCAVTEEKYLVQLQQI